MVSTSGGRDKKWILTRGVATALILSLTCAVAALSISLALSLEATVPLPAVLASAIRPGDVPSLDGAPPGTGGASSAAAAAASGGSSSSPGQYPRPQTHAERRFPAHGTAAYERTCEYMNRIGSGLPSCRYYATVDPWSSEGISAWASNVTALILYAAESKCVIKVDYGPDVDLTEVLAPIQLLDEGAQNEIASSSSSTTGLNGTDEVARRRVLNWTVSPSFSCTSTGRCAMPRESSMYSARWRSALERLFRRRGQVELPLVVVPAYRLAYNGGDHAPRRRAFENVTDILPGFGIETGMACAWNRLFRLSPSAAKYRPDLFTRILPAVHDEDAFVVTLYMRTKHADRTSRQIGLKKAITEDRTPIRDAYLRVCECAAHLEKAYLLPGSSSGAPPGPPLASARKIVWLVVTDSPKLSAFVASTYDTTSAQYKGNLTTFLPRSVVATSSRGVHSKPKHRPGTATFADSFLDWWLVGESDVVVSHGSLSFGSTGALRTARPVYDTSCDRLTLVREED